MPQFAEDINSFQQFQENQAAHYGLSNGRPKEVNESMRSAQQTRGRQVQRKPVSAGSRPEGASQAIPRKPVAGSASRTQSPYSASRTQSPAANNRARPDTNKPLPTLPDQTPARNVINRAPDGKYYSQNILTVDPIRGSRDARRTESSAPQRPGSASGWSTGSRKPESRSGSRRGSLSESAKKAGEWIKSKSKIVAMDKTERSSFVTGAKLNYEREVESARRRYPDSRPEYQQEYLAAKQAAQRPHESFGVGPASSSYEAAMQQRAFANRVNSGYSQQSSSSSGQQGKSPIPSFVRLSPPPGSLDSEERADALATAGVHNDPAEFQGFGAGDRFAMQVSKLLDGIKSRPRKNSDDSDMSFGLTDHAPAEAMYVCGSVPGENFGKGCKRPVGSFLKAGLCENCYTYQQVKRSRGPSHSPRRKGTPPKSPPDEAAGTNLYMKLPGHNLRKVRDTMYGDPGNPFAEEPEHTLPLPKNSFSSASSGEPSAPYSEEWPMSSQHSRLRPPRPTTDMLSTISDPFDLATMAETISNYVPSRESLEQELFVYAPAPCRRGTPTVVKADRRSMSVDIVFSPTGNEQYSPLNNPGERRRSGSLPTLRVQPPRAHTAVAATSSRDTAFYAFYDDVLADYGVR